MEFFREPPGVIARKFTLGQLALIAWRMQEQMAAADAQGEIVGRDADLRRMTGSELNRHLAQMGV